MTELNYPDFLAARLDDLEEDRIIPETRREWELDELVLADVAAKRDILEQHRKAVAHTTDFSLNALRIRKTRIETYLAVIKQLCRPFSDHPDYPGEL